MLSQRIQKFISLEAASGVFLLLALFIALIIANSPLDQSYQQLLDTKITLTFGPFELSKPALLWVNEGLMAIFFMLLALEIKREFIEGELSQLTQVTLPFVGAIGGIGVPILIFALFNHGNSFEMRGWPIPTTTDVAFMLGIVALLGPRVPTSLKVTLVALSIVDDIVAIIIIAVSYSGALSWVSFAIGLSGVLLLILFNVSRVVRIAPYMIVGAIIWIAVLKSGIHATLAGVIVGLLMPLKNARHPERSPLRTLERLLHPWVAYGVLPIFVLFNGAVPFAGFNVSEFARPLALGISLGLFLGKSLGVFACCWLAIKLGLARLPSQSNYRQLLGVSALTGIGFTMSLFLSALAFANTEYENLSRQAVLLGSLCACVFGVCLLLKKPR